MHHFAASAVASFFASSPVLISKLRDNNFQQSAAWCVCGCSLRVFLQMVQCMRRSTLLRLFTPSKGHGSGRVIAMDSLLLLAQVALTTPSAVSNHGQRSQYIATSPALAKNLTCKYCALHCSSIFTASSGEMDLFGTLSLRILRCHSIGTRREGCYPGHRHSPSGTE